MHSVIRAIDKAYVPDSELIAAEVSKNHYHLVLHDFFIFFAENFIILITVQKEFEQENKQNQKDQEKNAHRVVLYGDKIQVW